MPPPAKFDMKDAVPLDASAPAKFDMANAVPLVDFSANENSEGLYKMIGKDGATLHVPFSRVNDARTSGYAIAPEDTKRFTDDYQASLSEAHTAGNYAKESVFGTGRGLRNNVVGAYQTIRHPIETIKSTVQQTEGALKAADKENADLKNAYPTNSFKDKGVRGVAALGTFLENAPLIGGMVQRAEQGGSGMGSPESVGAGFEAATTFAAPEVAGKVFGKIRASEPIRSTLKRFTDSGPAQIGEMAENTVEKNREAAKIAKEANTAASEEHLNKTLDSLQKTREAEDTFSHDERTRSDELKAKNEADRKKFNENELERINKEGDDRLEVLRKNKDKTEDYQKKIDEAKADTAKNYRREVQRQNIESKLKSASKLLDEKYRKAFSSARSQYNATWNKWRDQVKNAKADMNLTVDAIHAQEKSMNSQQVTQFREILRETTPTREDLSELNQLRYDIVKGNGWGESYDTLTNARKQSVDNVVGDLNLNNLSNGGSSGLKDVSAERLHTWKSQLERAVRTTQDGTVRSAIGKVLDQLRKEEENVSATVGPQAVRQLAKARAITGPYFDAFYKSPEDMPKAAGQSLREQSPEYVKERNQQARLDRIAAYDPSIKSTANNVANLQEALGNAPKPKPVKDLPPRPDLATPPSVRPVGEFTPKPFEPNTPPSRDLVPNRPPEVIPEKTTISIDDIKNERLKNIKESSKRTENQSKNRALNAVFYSIPSAITSLVFGHYGMMGAAEIAGAVTAGIPIILASSDAIKSALGNKAIANWIADVTPKDVAKFKSLPPEYKDVFAKNVQNLANEAKKRGMKVSPAVSSFAAIGNSAESYQQNNKYTHTAENSDGHQIGSNDGATWYDVKTGKQVQEGPKELLQQAQDLQSQFRSSGLSQ